MEVALSTIQVISFNLEFLASTISKQMYLREERLAEAFRMFDKDGSGKISMSEIEQVLGGSKEENEKLREKLKKFDINKDGEIDSEEFITMMSQMESLDI